MIMIVTCDHHTYMYIYANDNANSTNNDETH